MLVIREYRDSDFPIVWDLHVKALQDIGVYLGEGVRDNDLHNVQKIYFDNNGTFLVGELNGKIVAMGAFMKKSKTIAQIRRMRVFKEFQGKGYGKQILTELEKRAKKMGYKKFYLTTSTEQIGAFHFYKNNGFINTKNLSSKLPEQTTYKSGEICELVFEKKI